MSCRLGTTAAVTRHHLADEAPNGEPHRSWHSALPVSTRHVLSSGVAGTMAAHRTRVQIETVRNLMLAWVLSLPVSTLLAGALFWLFSSFR